MLNICLVNGERKWVTKHEARLLQSKGKVVCVLDIREDEDDLNFYSISGDCFEVIPSAC